MSAWGERKAGRQGGREAGAGCGRGAVTFGVGAAAAVYVSQATNTVKFPCFAFGCIPRAERAGGKRDNKKEKKTNEKGRKEMSK